MFWLNTSFGSTREEALQSLVFESYDHTYSVTWVVTSYKTRTPKLTGADGAQRNQSLAQRLVGQC